MTLQNKVIGGRKPYTSPRLTVYGEMAKVTAAGSAGNKENTGNDNQAIRIRN